MERFLLLLVIAALLVVGWNHPLRDQFDRLTGKTATSPVDAVPPAEVATPAGQTQAAQPQMIPSSGLAPAKLAPASLPSATPDRNWMFKKGNMDAPHK